MVVQWLGLLTSTAGGTDSIPGWGTESPQAARVAKRRKRKSENLNCRNRNQINNDLQLRGWGMGIDYRELTEVMRILS